MHKLSSGQLKNFTGIDSPYEEPQNPEIIVETETYHQKNARANYFLFIGKGFV